MRILKSNSLLRLFNSYLVDSPQPANISYLWNFGSLLALCLIIQILSGVFLAMKKYALPNISNYICKTLLDAEIGLKTKILVFIFTVIQ